MFFVGFALFCMSSHLFAQNCKFCTWLPKPLARNTYMRNDKCPFAAVVIGSGSGWPMTASMSQRSVHVCMHVWGMLEGMSAGLRTLRN